MPSEKRNGTEQQKSAKLKPSREDCCYCFFVAIAAELAVLPISRRQECSVICVYLFNSQLNYTATPFNYKLAHSDSLMYSRELFIDLSTVISFQICIDTINSALIHDCALTELCQWISVGQVTYYNLYRAKVEKQSALT